MSQKIKDYITIFHDYGIYIPTRSVSICEEFNESLYETTLKNLHALDSGTGNINIFINSGGGDIEVCRALYDAIKGCRSHVIGLVYGQASSSASLLLQACDERLMTPNSHIMVHYGSESSPESHPIDKKRWDDHNKMLTKWMEDVYLNKIKEKHPRYTRKKLTELLVHDTIIYPKECVELGLADKIEEEFYYDKKN